MPCIRANRLINLWSVLNNPYYISVPSSGLVAPDAHNFLFHLMSNRSAENKGGVLNGEVLKSVFAVSGTSGNFVHHPGLERIPFDWYKCPSSQPMDTVDTNLDNVINNQMYPSITRSGGNSGKQNSFVGLDLGDSTGGVFNGANVFEGNNLACFFLQVFHAGLIDFDTSLLEPIGEVRSLLRSTLGPAASALSCPQRKSFNNTPFKEYLDASNTG